MRSLACWLVVVLLLSVLPSTASVKPFRKGIKHSVAWAEGLPANSLHLPVVAESSAPASPASSLKDRLQSISRAAAMLGSSATLTAKLAVYYFLLYFFTVVYNIANKKLLLAFPHPITVAALQTMIGIPMFLPIWALKPPKNLRKVDISKHMAAAGCHALGNMATVCALFSGSVSFTHVVKAAEPLFSAGLSAVVLKSKLSTEVYVTLLPVVLGVGLASAKDLSFSWTALTAAMISNFFYQLRMVLSKQSMSDEVSRLSAGNAFRVMTLLSALLLLPMALLFEGDQVMAAWSDISNHGELVRDLLVSGAAFYLYNEISFWILDLVHPVALAVGNTIKRVVLIASAVVFFHSPLDPMGALGAAVAIAGSLLYALAAQRQAGSA